MTAPLSAQPDDLGLPTTAQSIGRLGLFLAGLIALVVVPTAAILSIAT